MASKTSSQVAVLFLIFNRLDTTKQVFQSIREAKPPRLYISSDGPRSTHPDEDEKVQAVREYVLEKIDWECEVKTLFRDENLGCKHAVESAITWFFDHEEMGIILEDDCLPVPIFFTFCQELLEHYRYDTRIMAISGDNFQPRKSQTTKYSYYFSRYPHCWGWATWKRAWFFYDPTMKLWPEFRDGEWMKNAYNSWSEKRYKRRVFQKVYNNELSSWAYLWEFTCLCQSGLTILPKVNLVSNIGFSQESTHTKASKSPLANLPADSIQLPISHPPFVVRQTKFDNFTYKKMYGLLSRIFRKTRSIFNI